MEFKNIEQLYSSEHSHIFLVEGSDGKLYTKKDSGISPEVADKLGNVRSPYVAALADYGEDYTILEYAQGTPLNEVKLTPKRACEIFRELCDGISAFHREGILHRDIKPSNVIVCDDGHIKIIDFDAARIKKPAADKDTVFMGTDGFAPPEQFGFTQTDERSDIYALGVTFKIILGENYQHSRYRYLIDKCMRFNPEQRYKSTESVKRDLAFSEYIWVLCAAGVLLLAGCIVCISVNSKRSEIQGEDINSLSTSDTIFTNEETKNSTTESPTKENTHNQSETSIIASTAETFESAEIKNVISDETETTSEPVTFPEYSAPQTQISSSSTTSIVTTPAIQSTPSATKATAPPVSQTEESHESTITVNDFEVPEDSQRPVLWGLMWLPEGFPRLADGVTAYSSWNNRATLEWDKMSYEEAEYIYSILDDWLKSNDETYVNEGNGLDHYTYKYSGSMQYLDYYEDENCMNKVSISIIGDFPYYVFDCDYATMEEITVEGSGDVRWEDIEFLSGSSFDEFPHLAKYVSEVFESDNEIIIYTETSLMEAAKIAYDVTQWLSECSQAKMDNDNCTWIWDDIQVEWFNPEKNDNQNYTMQITISK